MNSMWITIDGFRPKHAFTTRQGGTSPSPFDTLDLSLVDTDAEKERAACIHENARRLAQSLGLSPRAISAARQVHGTRILRITSRESSPSSLATIDEDVCVWEYIVGSGDRSNDGLGPTLGDADGLITDKPGIALAVRTADCTPILLASLREDRPVIAAIHAGWRGTIGGIQQRTVALMTEHFGLRPEEITAAIGPCIDACCYEVSASLAHQFATTFTEDCVVPSVDSEHGPKLSLKVANALALERAGLLRKHIFVSDRCTACDAENFFSYRRDGGITGRQLSIIWL